MEDQKMQIIQELMEQLQGLMEPGQDELGDRLGRPKVQIDVQSSKSLPMGGDGDGMDPMMNDHDADDMPMDHDMDMDSPEEKLKQRILKLRA